jgi:hypothetical protein
MKRLLSVIVLACGCLSVPAEGQATDTVGEPGLTRRVRSLALVSQFHVGVPLLLDTDRETVRPGANLGARFSLMSRYFGGGIHGSYQWIPIDEGRADTRRQTGGRMPLRRAAFGPFVAAELPNLTSFTPYAQGGFDLNFWNFAENALICDFWQCVSSNVYHFTAGFHGRLGGRFALATRRRVFLDLGLEGGVSFPGGFFERTQPWATPYLGVGVAN